MHRQTQFPHRHVLNGKSPAKSTSKDDTAMYWSRLLVASTLATSVLAALRKPYSVSLNEPHPHNHGATRRLRDFEDGLTTTIPGFPKILTVYDLVKDAVQQFQDKDCLGSRRVLRKTEEEKLETKVVNGAERQVAKKWIYSELSPYEFRTYADLGKEAASIGAGLRKLGLDPGDHVGLYADTS
jgi:long-chain acyl-CoA synthetase